MITIRNAINEKIVLASVVNEIVCVSRRMAQIARELETDDEYRNVRDLVSLVSTAMQEEAEILRGVEDSIPEDSRYIRPMGIVNTIYEDWFHILSVCLNQLKSCVLDLLTVYAAMMRRGDLMLAEVVYASSERIDGWANEVEIVIVSLTTVCDEE
jgi:hypothetical protein